MPLAPINCSVKWACCCSSLDQNTWHTQHAFYSHLISSLAAASFECWGPDHNFSWQRHPSLHLCCYLASQPTHLACCASDTLISWTREAGSEPQNKAPIKLKYIRTEKSLAVRKSVSRAELLLSPLPRLTLHCGREKASASSFWEVFLHPSLLHPWVQPSLCCSDSTFSKRAEFCNSPEKTLIMFSLFMLVLLHLTAEHALHCHRKFQ